MGNTNWTTWNNALEFTDNNKLDNFSNGEKQVIDQTRAWAENLRSAAIDASLSSVDTKSDLMIQQTWMQLERDIHTFDWFLPVLDKLLQEIEETKAWISKKWLTKAWKISMEENKVKLKQYKKQLKGKRRALLKQTNVQIYDNDIDHVRNIWQQIEQIRKNIGMAQRGEYASIASYLYNSPENIRKATRYQAKALEFNQKMEQELRDATIQNIFLRQSINAVEFYRKANEWQLTQAEYQFFVTNSDILIPSFQRCGIAIPSGSAVINWQAVVWPATTWRSAEIVSSAPRGTANYGNMERWETFQKWWVAGVLDKLLSNCGNMTPWQKETWKTLWVLGWFAAWIFWLYKFYTNDKLSFLEKAWITAWAIFWSQMLTWEWPISLFGKFMTGGLSMEELKNKFGNAVWWMASSNGTGIMWVDSWNTNSSGGWADSSGGWASSSGGWTGSSSSSDNWVDSSSAWGESASETIVPSMYSLMVFNALTKVSDVDNMTKEFAADNEKWKIFYEQACQKLEKEYGKEVRENFQVTFSDKFDKDAWKNWLATFGITDSTDRKESVYWLSSNAIMNEVILKKFKDDYWLKEIWNKDLNVYVKGKRDNKQPIDVDDLELHKADWFKENEEATNTHRPEDEKNKTALENQVKALSLGNPQENELIQAVKDFYDERAIKNKPKLNDFSLKMQNGLLVMKSHGWNETKIDLTKNTLKSKNNIDIAFPTLSEALNTADLTNDILWLTKGKAVANNPDKEQCFQYQTWRKGICFNNATNWSFDKDTRIKSISRFWNRSTIDKNASTYANYLSERRKEVNKLNLTKYPLVSKLWIVFYWNEDEVKRLETWLWWVKSKLKNYQSRKGKLNPFSINLSKNLKFNWMLSNQPAELKISENISEEFPTLEWEWNEKLFLDAINDEKNWMYVKGK